MNEESDDSLLDAIHERMRLDRKRELKNQYSEWCREHAELPTNYVPLLKTGLIADLELQPMRWMRSGLELIESAKGTTSIQLFDNTQGPALQTYLSYPVFQGGTEIFLKGMWLAQYPDCRAIGSSDYVGTEVRRKYAADLKKLGHNLLRIISAVQQIELYRTEGNITRFLKIISGVTRRFYYPLTTADTAWGNARYPRRFYDDKKREGHADQLKSYPEQWHLALLFQDTIKRVDKLWSITEGLTKRVRKDNS